MDQQDLASYTPAQIYANSVTDVAIKTQTDKLAFTVTNQVDANVLDWKSTPAPAMTGDAYAVANGRLPAALTANGNMKSSLVEILATALTETAGQIATAFIKFFDKASPTGTVNSLPDAVAGANGGLTTTDGAKVNQTVDLTSGQSIAVSDKTGFSLSTAGILAIWNQLETDAGLIANSIGLKLHTLLVSAGGKVSAILLRWLTDDAPGTPLALTDAQLVQADAIKEGGTNPNNLAAGAAMTLTSAYDAAKTANSVAPDNADIAAIKADVESVTYGLNALLTAINSRLATSGYTAPDNASIADILSDITNGTYGLSSLLTEIGNAPNNTLASAVDGAVTLKQAVEVMLAVLTGKANGGGTTTITFKDPSGTITRITMTVDPDTGDRSVVVLNP